jgi:hypothetical protein
MKKKTRETSRPLKFLKEHPWEVICTVITVVGISLCGFIPAYRGETWNAENAGQFGDFIGGYFGTIFFVLSVFVLVVSYRNQRFSNKLIAFESRFFELLQYHRDNTIEIEVETIKGRRAFVSFLREWRLLVALVKAAETATGEELTVHQRSVLSYLAFFHGSGPNARVTFILEASKNKFPPVLVAEVIKMMSVDWAVYKEYIGKSAIECNYTVKMSSGTATKAALQPLQYIPFEGHHSRLAHYFRHLYHLAKYAAIHAPDGTAQEYADLVSAQLTTHEQAFLALHAYAIGGVWKSDDTLQKFHLIKNIPPGFLKDDEFPFRKIFPEVAYTGG